MQTTNAEIAKVQTNIASSFVGKASLFVPRLQKSKSVKGAFEVSHGQLKKESVTLKSIEKSFIQIERNLRAMRLFTMAFVDLSKPEEEAPRRAGRRRRAAIGADRVEPKPSSRKKPRFPIFSLKVKKRTPRKLKVKPRTPRKRIKPSALKRTTNKKLRNVFNRLKARVKIRLAKLAGLRRYRANVEASRIQRRLERARLKEEARALRQRLLDDQNRRIRLTEAEARQIRANADADASRIRSNAQTEAQRRVLQAENDAVRVRSEAETRARSILNTAEAESRQKIDAANRQVVAANERVQQVNEEVKRIETRRQQFTNDAAEAQRVIREAQTELKRVETDKGLAAAEKERLLQRQQQLIRENESIRVTLRDEAAKLDIEKQRIQTQITEEQSRLTSLQNSAEEIRLSEQRRIQRLVSSGEVPIRPSAEITAAEPRARVSDTLATPPRTISEPLNRVFEPEVGRVPPPATQPPRQQVAALLRAPGEPVAPVNPVQRTKQIAALLSRPPAIKVSQNILTQQQKIILTNSVQKVVSGSAVKTVTFISRNIPGISLLVGAGFTIKSAVVDRTKVGTALNAYATLTPSFIGALATIYPLTVNEAYRDVFGVYPEYDPDPIWFNKLLEIHVLIYDEVKEALEKLKASWNKSFDDLGNKWKEDLNRGVITTLSQSFDRNKPGPRVERERRRLQPSLISPSSSVNEAIMKASQLTGVDPKILLTIAMLESSGGRFLKNPNSSATGLFQFISSTWDQMKREYPQFADILNRGRMDFDASALAGALYIDSNSKRLAKAGIPINIETLYAAHFLGPGSFSRGAIGLYQLLQSDPNGNAAKYFPKEAAANQEIFFRKVRGQQTPRTISEVVEKLREKIQRASGALRTSDVTSNNVSSDVMKTSELIQNNQPNNQRSQNLVVLNNNTTLLSPKRAIDPYGFQESVFS